jgi:general secretion pathway protein J
VSTAGPRIARGFTLVELLVALFVLALLAMLSWRGLDGMVRTQASTQARADEVLGLQVGLSQWRTDLDAVVQLPQLQALDWNGRVLRLTRRGTSDVGDGVRVVAWALREGQWRRWQSPGLTTRGDVETAWQQADNWAQNPSDESRRAEVAVTPLEDWQVFYFRGDAWTNPQSSDAQAVQIPGGEPGVTTVRRTGLVPEGVRLVLTLPPGRAFSGRLTRDWVNPLVGGGRS